VTQIFARTEVSVIFKGKQGKVLLRQIRAIDRKKRLLKKMGSLSVEEMKLIDEAIRTVLDV
jgi:mRNA-degrading endonuclease toxin of MazEF toxin-antitoxin module